MPPLINHILFASAEAAVLPVQADVVGDVDWMEIISNRRLLRNGGGRRSPDALNASEDPEFFDNLRALFDQKHATRIQAAKLLGIKASVFGQMLDGGRGLPFAMMPKLANYLRVKHETLDLRHDVLTYRQTLAERGKRKTWNGVATDSVGPLPLEDTASIDVPHWTEVIQTQRSQVPARHHLSAKHLYPVDDPQFFDALKKIVHEGRHSARDVDRAFGFAKGGFNYMLHGTRGLPLEKLPAILRFLEIPSTGNGTRADVIAGAKAPPGLTPQERDEIAQQRHSWEKLRAALQKTVDAHGFSKRRMKALVASESLYNFVSGRADTVKFDVVKKLATAVDAESPQAMVDNAMPEETSVDLSFMQSAFINEKPKAGLRLPGRQGRGG